MMWKPEKQLYVGPRTFIQIVNFPPIRDCKYNKPDRGLWTSRYRPRARYPSAWAERFITADPMELREKFHGYIIHPSENAKVYCIDTYEDLHTLHKRFKKSADQVDWVQAARTLDGVQVTAHGASALAFTEPLDLFGWDIESTVWFRPAFEKVEEFAYDWKNMRRIEKEK